MGRIVINDQNLESEYIKYFNDKGEFLLFDLANGKENAHTNVLLSLLRHNNYQFVKSFLNLLELPERYNDEIIISNQVKAYSGYIDLYIEYKSTNEETIKVIIENKICGASDGKQQLARYIGWANGIEENRYTAWYDSIRNNGNINPPINRNIYVVYLTVDGTKEPSHSSLPTILKEAVNYRSISYQDHIFPWLVMDVLPQTTFSLSGMMIAGLQQYIASLDRIIQNAPISFVVNSYISNISSNGIYEKYEKISDIIEKKIKELKDKKDNIKRLAIEQLVKELKSSQKQLFNDLVPQGWKVEFLQSYIIMYKNVWCLESEKIYNIHPSILFKCTPTKNFFKERGKLKWRLEVNHISDLGEFQGNNTWSRNGNGIVKELRGVERLNIRSDDKCKEYFSKVIEYNETIVKFIDNHIKGNDNLYQDNLFKAICNNY